MRAHEILYGPPPTYDSGLSAVWLILIAIVLVVALASFVGTGKSANPLDKEIDKIFSQLETEARRWGRAEAVPPINEAHAKVTKLLRERKLL